ncbi:hypothetical protein BDW74DRAFT_180335 [Aspergillus multicolor]|uniref:uncharacterized protein n=1 Tax=Aspergillus multicolor TaxID=41759 RepID=UPI003CCD5145
MATMFIQFSNLSAFHSRVEEMDVPQYTTGFYGNVDQAIVRSKKTEKERFLDDRIILSEILSEVFTLHKIMPAQSYEDEFTRGLRNMFETKEIPFWLVFAAQVFLDLHSVLGRFIVRPHQHLTLYARKTELHSAQLEMARKTRRSPTIPFGPPQRGLVETT